MLRHREIIGSFREIPERQEGEAANLRGISPSNINSNKSMCGNIGKTSRGGGVTVCVHAHVSRGRMAQEQGPVRFLNSYSVLVLCSRFRPGTSNDSQVSPVT